MTPAVCSKQTSTVLENAVVKIWLFGTLRIFASRHPELCDSVMFRLNSNSIYSDFRIKFNRTHGPTKFHTFCFSFLWYPNRNTHTRGFCQTDAGYTDMHLRLRGDGQVVCDIIGWPSLHFTDGWPRVINRTMETLSIQYIEQSLFNSRLINDQIRAALILHRVLVWLSI